MALKTNICQECDTGDCKMETEGQNQITGNFGFLFLPVKCAMGKQMLNILCANFNLSVK